MKDFCSDKMKDALDKKDSTAAEVEEADATIEKKQNAKTLADAMAGKGAVEMAINILKKFYGFLQMGSKRGPDREGNTVSDLAPDSFEGDYKKRDEESGGIMAILEMILSDFESTIEETKATEQQGEEDFEKFDKESSSDDEAMNKQKEEKEKLIADLKEENAELHDTILGGEMALKNSAEELKKLQAMCVFGAENYEEKVKRRKEEIKSLK